MGTGDPNAGSNSAMDCYRILEGVETLLVTSCHRNKDKLWPDMLTLPQLTVLLPQGRPNNKIILYCTLITPTMQIPGTTAFNSVGQTCKSCR